MRVGFRFRRSQARVLDAMVARLEADGQHEHVTLFRLAGDAARTGDPLFIECSNEIEMRLIAAGFAQFPGVLAPTIDEVAQTPGG